MQPKVRRATRHGHHARRCRRDQLRQKQIRQGERAEEVAAELELEAVSGQHPFRHRHHACVVDQHGELLAVRQVPVGERVHAGEVSEVDAPDLERRAWHVLTDLGGGRMALGS
jgi:hypothetical protein